MFEHIDRLLDIGVGVLIAVSAATLFFTYNQHLSQYFNTSLTLSSEQKYVTTSNESVKFNHISGSEVILQLINRDKNHLNIEVDGQQYTYHNNFSRDDRIKEDLSFINHNKYYSENRIYDSMGKLVEVRYMEQ